MLTCVNNRICTYHFNLITQDNRESNNSQLFQTQFSVPCDSITLVKYKYIHTIERCINVQTNALLNIDIEVNLQARKSSLENGGAGEGARSQQGK